MNQQNKAVLPLVILFIVLNGLFVGGSALFSRWGINRDILIIANIVLFLVSLVSFLIQKKGLTTKNPHAFVRSVMGSMLIRMSIAVAAFVFYLMMTGKDVDKGAVFICMFLYILYLVVEVALMMKLNRRSNG